MCRNTKRWYINKLGWTMRFDISFGEEPLTSPIVCTICLMASWIICSKLLFRTDGDGLLLLKKHVQWQMYNSPVQILCWLHPGNWCTIGWRATAALAHNYFWSCTIIGVWKKDNMLFNISKVGWIPDGSMGYMCNVIMQGICLWSFCAFGAIQGFSRRQH